MNLRERQFEEILRTFPDAAREHVRSVENNAGKLSAARCKTIVEILATDIENLMIRLLPIAKLYAITPISEFQVGAVARALAQAGADEFDLYLGANIEFPGQALNQAVHAEQAATMNAWLQGAVQVRSIAVSAIPCGYCRQFLYELEGSDALMIVRPCQGSGGFCVSPLSELLFSAFGPRDLKKKAGLMAPPKTQPNLTLKTASADALVLEALSAANKSYAPYTNNLSGCAIEASDGQIYKGRYAENAAFNPSLSPLQTAISCMNLGRLAGDQEITRAVLVEKPSGSKQRGITELILRSFAPHVSLEYFEAQ